MDDSVASGAWQLDNDTRRTLRVERIRSRLAVQDFDEAILEAEELLEEEPNHAQGLLLLAEAMLALGDSEGAVAVFEHHLSGADPPTADALTGLAIARFEAVLLQGALEAAREAIRLAPDNAEAHFTLGLALEFLDRKSDAARSFVAAQQLDPVGFPLPMQLTESQVVDALAEALGALPEPLRRLWTGVSLEIEAVPTLELVRSHRPPLPPTLAGLYLGTPDHSLPPFTLRPEALHLFKDNLERTGSWEALVDQLYRLLEQEGLGWLGIELEDLGHP